MHSHERLLATRVMLCIEQVFGMTTCPSVCHSRYCIKTAKGIVEILSLPDSDIMSRPLS